MCKHESSRIRAVTAQHGPIGRLDKGRRTEPTVPNDKNN